MKKSLLLLSILIQFLWANSEIFTNDELKYIENKKIKIAVLPDFRPFNNYENGKFSGLSNDILELLAKKHNLKFQIEVDHWPKNLEKFKNNQVDLIDAISYEESRLAYTNYTKAYYEIPLVIFSKKELDNYKTLSDLKGKKLGLTKNIYYKNIIEEKKIFDIREFDNVEDKIKALAFGDIDIMFGHLLSTQAYIVKNGYTNIKVLDEVKIPEISKTDLRYGINKKNLILTSIMQKAINDITASEWNGIYSKWITEINLQNKITKQGIPIFSNEELNYINNKKVIKVQNEKNWPPYNFNLDGEPKGFSIDYTNLIAKKAGLKVQWIKDYSWSEYMDMLKNGEIDVINNISKNKEREEFINFTDIFHTAANAIYVKKGNENLDSLEKLKGKTIIMPKGFFAQQLIEKHYPEIKQIQVKDSLEALRQLSLGKADATIGKKNVIDYIISTNNISGVIATNFVDDNRLVSLIRMGVPKGEKELQSILQKSQDSVTDEELLNLKRKWFGEQNFSNKIKKIEFSNKEKEYLSQKTTINYCINENLKPIDFINENSDHDGISKDILKLISQSTNIKFNFIETNSFKDSLNYLNDKKCDILTGIENNSLIDKKITLSHPYLNYKLGIITRKDIPVMASIEEIINKPISLKSDSQLISELKSNYPDIKIIEKNSTKRALEAVNNNETYYTLAPLPIASFYMNEYAMNNLYIARYTNISFTVNMAINSQESLLIDIINKAIKNISIDEKREIMNKWSNFSKESEFNYSLFWKIFIFVFLFLLILLYRQIILNRHNQELIKANNEIAELSSSLEKRVEEEIKKNEQKTNQLIQQSRLAQMGELINMIAHQWRQPLTAISATTNNLSFKYLLNNNNIDQDEILKELKLISDYSHHLSSTIDDFRNFYKKDKTKKLITLEYMVKQALNIIKPSLDSNLIKINTDFNSNIKVNTYPSEINHVVLNILKNSEDVILDKKINNPIINITTYDDKDNVYLIITDNGGGINNEVINQIFEPYFTTKINSDGTGLGLYMSKIIIEEHCKGKLEVKNINEGVEFKISIPKDLNE